MTALTLPPPSKPIPGPGRFIPVADLRAARQSPLRALLRVARQYGDVFQYPVGFWTIFFVNHPDAVRRVLQDNQRNYTKATFQYRLLGLAAGEGLLTSDGAHWLQQRRLAQPAFHRERLARLGAGMAEAAAAMVARWEPLARRGEPLDVDEEMMRLTLEIVGRALFSADLRREAAALTAAALAALDHVLFRARMPFALPPQVPTPRNRRFRAARQTLDQAVHALIARRRAEGGDAGDLLSMLLLARDEETGERMSDQQVRDELVTLLIAGHETVASALTWTWYLLSLHPAADRQLHAEAAAALAGRAPTVADLPRLPYARQVFDETLRLYPPAWLVTRRALAADTLNGHALPANALVVLSPYAMHRHPDFWDNPEGFDPERFGPEPMAARPRFAYFPFGGGPRGCIGNHFALMEAQMVLATVAQRFRLDLVPGHPVEVEPRVTLRPKHGLWMTLRERH